jgi:predicted esterase
MMRVTLSRVAAFALAVACGACHSENALDTKPGAKVGKPHANGRDDGDEDGGPGGGADAWADEDGGVVGGEGGRSGSGHPRGGAGGATTAPGDGGLVYVDGGVVWPSGSGGAGDTGSGGTTAPPPPAVMLPDIDFSYDGDAPPDDHLPKPKGTCPTFDKMDDYVFDVQGGRAVFIGVDASKAAKKSSQGGPVVFYWHGTNSGPAEASYALSDVGIQNIMDQGGIVAGFYSTMNWPDKGSCDECRSSTGNGVWFTEDFNLADEVLACAIEQLHVDTRRIHVTGMSAGGLQATAMLYARSNYIASAAPYSGGILFGARARQDPDNHVPAMIFHGTYADDYVGIHFYSTSKTLFDDVTEDGGLAIDCNHGQGHIIPLEGGPAVWAFFMLHPYKAPSPWAGGLPDYLPAYCSLTFQ